MITCKMYLPKSVYGFIARTGLIQWKTTRERRSKNGGRERERVKERKKKRERDRAK